MVKIDSDYWDGEIRRHEFWGKVVGGCIIILAIIVIASIYIIFN